MNLQNDDNDNAENPDYLREFLPTHYSFPLSCTKTIKLTIPPAMCERLDEIARSKRSSRLNVIRYSIEKYLDGEHSSSL